MPWGPLSEPMTSHERVHSHAHGHEHWRCGCGAEFHSKEELETHKRAAHKV